MSKLLGLLEIMNTKFRLISSTALVLGTIGFGSLAIANLTNHHKSNSAIAQNSDGMNHGGMKKGGTMDHNMDVGPADANYDLRFIDSMIPHHQGAVTMGQDSLKKSQRPEMQKLSQSIIKSQQAEIDLMNQWRKKWYGNKK